MNALISIADLISNTRDGEEGVGVVEGASGVYLREMEIISFSHGELILFNFIEHKTEREGEREKERKSPDDILQ